MTDRPAELLAGAGVLHGRLEGALRQSERDRRGAQALAVVGGHQLLEAARGEEVLAGDPATVEDDLPFGDAAHPHRALAPCDPQTGVPASTISAPIPADPDGVEPAQHHVGLRDPRARDPALGSAEHPRIAGPLGVRLELGGRGAGARLGDGDCRLVPLEHRGEYFCFWASDP